MIKKREAHDRIISKMKITCWTGIPKTSINRLITTNKKYNDVESQIAPKKGVKTKHNVLSEKRLGTMRIFRFRIQLLDKSNNRVTSGV